MAIEVVNLRNGLEDKFWQYVRRDPLDYRRFISDWKYDKQDADIHLALKEGEIAGLMLVFRKSKVHLRGSPEAVESLLDYLDLDEFDLIAPLECKDLILERHEPQISSEMYMMYVTRGEERIQKKHDTVELTTEDAGQIAKLMRVSDPVWAETTSDRIKDMMSWSYWLGIRRDDEIVCIGKTTFSELGSVVGVVATEEEHKNKGYATSVVSALVEEAFRRFDKALIFVLTDNRPAIHVYRKIGFRPYKTYFFLKKRATQSE